MKILPILGILCITAISTGCEDEYPVLPQQKTEGVVLYGCNNSSGTLHNANNYPVRIRKVLQGEYSERTVYIKTLEPGENRHFDRISRWSGFYIYTMDGIMIGFISGSCPQK